MQLDVAGQGARYRWLPLYESRQAGGESAQPEEVAFAIHHVEAELLVKNSGPSAKHGLPIAEDVVGKTDARREVVVIAVIGIIGLDHAPDGIEIPHQAVFFMDDSVELVPHAEIKGEARCHAPVILQERGIAIVVQVTRSVTKE